MLIDVAIEQVKRLIMFLRDTEKQEFQMLQNQQRKLPLNWILIVISQKCENQRKIHFDENPCDASEITSQYVEVI